MSDQAHSTPVTEADLQTRDNQVVADTVRWLERAVIGLNLCPFAKGVHVKDQIHYVVSRAQDARELADELHREL